MRYALLPALALTLCAICVAPAGAAGRHIYPAPELAAADLAAGLQTAAAGHKRVLVDFGGDWCTDCQVLDLYLHDAANAALLAANYVLVHVNVGRMLERNLDIAEKLEIPLKKGVPALAVLEPDGRIVYSQKSGEFEAMRHMESAAVTGFLTQWRPR